MLLILLDTNGMSGSICWHRILIQIRNIPDQMGSLQFWKGLPNSIASSLKQGEAGGGGVINLVSPVHGKK